MISSIQSSRHCFVSALALIAVAGLSLITPSAQLMAADDDAAKVVEPVDKKESKKHIEASESHANEHVGDSASGTTSTASAAAHGTMGNLLPPWTILPFALLLLCIAVLPLATPHWWEHNSNKMIVVLGLSVPLALYLLSNFGAAATHELVDKVKEYVSFMLLLGALYIISGGIYIRGSLSGTPLSNTIMLGIGAVIASIIGTTGASVVLIRPLLRANRTRKAKAHIVVFFIFIVSNCGGLLTPIGDPPLFLGFLKGVPFEWTLQHLWMQWLVVNAALLVIFNVWDQNVLDREERAREGSQLEEAMKHEPIGVGGGLNFLFLAGIVGIIIASGQGWLGTTYGVAELGMGLLAVVAYFTTATANRERNKFTFGPIIEVGVLFIGIFITMIPALLILNAWGQGHRPDFPPFAITQLWHYFWASGALSSFLDNAPTYLTFAATACGKQGVATEGAAYLKEFLDKGPLSHQLLEAISCGAVFMGANTYIGNGPNFMVKAIAEEDEVHMPSFFGYMAYSGMVLIPIFVVVTLIFFRG